MTMSYSVRAVCVCVCDGVADEDGDAGGAAGQHDYSDTDDYNNYNAQDSQSNEEVLNYDYNSHRTFNYSIDAGIHVYIPSHVLFTMVYRKYRQLGSGLLVRC